MIAIKDMELPKSCAECGFVTDDMFGDATCVLLCDEWKDNENHRAENCPLVEIVTCKECKYCRNKGDKYSYCTKRLNVDSVTDRYREPDFFCADAERKE